MTTVYIVLLHGSPVSVQTSVADGSNLAKLLGPGATMVSCRTNGLTDLGKQLLAVNPSLAGFGP